MLNNAKKSNDEMEKFKKQSKVLTKQVDNFEHFIYGNKRKSTSPTSPPIKEKQGIVSPATGTARQAGPLKKMGTMFVRKGTKTFK